MDTRASSGEPAVESWIYLTCQIYVCVSRTEHTQGFIEILNDWKYRREHSLSYVFKDEYISFSE